MTIQNYLFDGNLVSGKAAQIALKSPQEHPHPQPPQENRSCLMSIFPGGSPFNIFKNPPHPGEIEHPRRQVMSFQALERLLQFGRAIPEAAAEIRGLPSPAPVETHPLRQQTFKGKGIGTPGSGGMSLNF